MTRSSFFHQISACLLFFLGVLFLNACADEERKLPPTSPAGEGFSSQVLVLHQGNQATRLPGGYTLIDTEHQTVNHDAFLSVNGKLLGDTPQEAIQYGAKIYIPCYGSNLVQVVDATSHRLIKSIPTQAPEGVPRRGNTFSSRTMTAFSHASTPLRSLWISKPRSVPTLPACWHSIIIYM